MALFLSGNRIGGSRRNGKIITLSRPTTGVVMNRVSVVLLRIVLLLVTVVLLFQLKLVITVNNIQANVISTTSTTSTVPNNNNIIDGPSKQQSSQQTDSTKNVGMINKDKYKDCPFRDSSLVESIYVYPTPGSPEWDNDGSILSDYGRSNTIPAYPWVGIDQHSRENGIGPYQPTSQFVQYNTELLVRDVITHPDSCLRTYDPEKAALFYVPYWPATEFHNGTRMLGSFQQTPYGKALQDAIADGNYDNWERTFGLTSKYWQRRGGSDHIMVFSEPLHGLWHPRWKRGNYHFIRSQYQLRPPIVISVELSTTFVDMYPHCAKKNILMPYPNTDGRWFNGVLNEEAMAALVEMGIHNASTSMAALSSEVELERRALQSTTSFTLEAGGDGTATDAIRFEHRRVDTRFQPRVMGQFYQGGNHGECTTLRKSMKNDFYCTPSGKLASQHKMKNYAYGYRQSTFCPCPGGDSPSAKRMYDALLAGCIPVILSHDFVWPFTTEFDRTSAHVPVRTPPSSTTTVGTTGDGRNDGTRTVRLVDDDGSHNKIVVLNPNDYSIRLPAADHEVAKFNKKCERVQGDDKNTTDLQSLLDAIPHEEIIRLREGVAQAGYAYSYYRFRPDLPDNPLREGVLPDGGAAHVLVRALEERAFGKLWPDCQQELVGKNPDVEDEVSNFKC